MKLTITGLSILFSIVSGWNTDFEKAKAEALMSKKEILISFSGSDWCLPCMKMKKEIFDSPEFMGYSSEQLVLIHADFPRLKKNQLDKSTIAGNEALAEKFNPAGKFPFTVIVDPQSNKVIKEFEGLPDESPEKFVEEIKLAIHANK